MPRGGAEANRLVRSEAQRSGGRLLLSRRDDQYLGERRGRRHSLRRTAGVTRGVRRCECARLPALRPRGALEPATPATGGGVGGQGGRAARIHPEGTVGPGDGIFL